MPAATKPLKVLTSTVAEAASKGPRRAPSKAQTRPARKAPVKAAANTAVEAAVASASTTPATHAAPTADPRPRRRSQDTHPTRTHGDLRVALCPSREVLRHVTSQWGVLVLWVLSEGTYRFSELRRSIDGISERMLAQTLQWLEHDGLVKRVAHEVVPPHVDYSLTPLGRGAAERVGELAEWIEGNLPRVMAARAAHAAAR